MLLENLHANCNVLKTTDVAENKGKKRNMVNYAKQIIIKTLSCMGCAYIRLD